MLSVDIDREWNVPLLLSAAEMSGASFVLAKDAEPTGGDRDAVSALDNSPLPKAIEIPGSMGTASYIVARLANAFGFCSATAGPVPAGR